jgi:hypothetical protein
MPRTVRPNTGVVKGSGGRAMRATTFASSGDPTGIL